MGTLDATADEAQAIRARLISDYTSDLISFHTGTGITYITPSSQRLLGYRPDEMVGRTAHEFMHPDDRAHAAGFTSRCRGGEEPRYIVRLQCADGSYKWFDAIGRELPMIQHDGIPEIMVTSRDVTNQVAWAEQVARSDARYRHILETAHEGIWWFDEHDVTTSVNQRMAEMMATTVDEMIGKPIGDFVAEERRDLFAGLLQSVRGGEVARFERPVPRRDGTSIWANVVVAPYFAADGTYEGAVALARDVEAEQQARTDLERSEAQFRALVEQSTDMLTILSLDRTFNYTSAGRQRLLGYPDEISESEMAERRHPDDRQAIANEARRVIRGGHGTTGRWVGRIRHADGEYRVIETLARNMADDPGIRGLVLNSRDITARVESERLLREQALAVERLAMLAERERMEVELQRALRFESLGRLAGGVAHDFNNLLGVMANYLRVVVAHLDPESPAVEDAAQIEAAISRAAALTDELLLFGDRGDVPVDEIDVDGLIADVVGFSADLLGPGITVEHRQHDELATVMMSRVALERCVLNLLHNAGDAMPDGGTIVVAAANHDVTTEESSLEVAPGRYVALTVADTGGGMEPNVVASAVEPFFTTKSPDAGTGLGLAIVQSTMAAAGGAVHIRSAPGRGTSVSLLLPTLD